MKGQHDSPIAQFHFAVGQVQPRPYGLEFVTVEGIQNHAQAMMRVAVSDAVKKKKRLLSSWRPYSQKSKRMIGEGVFNLRQQFVALWGLGSVDPQPATTANSAPADGVANEVEWPLWISEREYRRGFGLWVSAITEYADQLLRESLGCR